MTPEQEIAELDRFIDRLLSGSAPTLDDVQDADLANLTDTVLELQRHAEPVWPDRDFPAIASAHIAEVLRSRAGEHDRSESLSMWPLSPNGHAQALPRAIKPNELLPPQSRGHLLKEIGQMAAAALALALVVGLLVLVLGDSGGSRFGRGSSRPTAGSSSLSQGVASAQGGEIVFASDRSGTYQIYAVKHDGADLRQLTNSTEANFAPLWSRDGKQIAFLRTKFIPSGVAPIPPAAVPPNFVYVMNADGTNLHNLTPEGSRAFRNLSWSPDGKQLAVECSPEETASSYGNGQICIVNVDGTGMHRIVPSELFGTSPAWSPDGRWIAFVGQPQPVVLPVGIYLVSPDGTQHRTVLKDADFPSSVTWSPDSHRLAYVHGMESRRLSVVDIDGSDQHDLDIGTRNPSDPSWSPVGNKLLLIATGVVIVNPDGSGHQQVVSTDNDVAAAIWSPDGQAVAFTQRGFGTTPGKIGTQLNRAQLLVAPLDGSPARTVVNETVATDGDGLLGWPPSWQPVTTIPGR
jgi:Tol biopolymer transport system component